MSCLVWAVGGSPIQFFEKKLLGRMRTNFLYCSLFLGDLHLTFMLLATLLKTVRFSNCAAAAFAIATLLLCQLSSV